MTQKLHKFVLPFTLYFNVENAQNPARNILKRPTYLPFLEIIYIWRL